MKIDSEIQELISCNARMYRDHIQYELAETGDWDKSIIEELRLDLEDQIEMMFPDNNNKEIASQVFDLVTQQIFQ